MSKYGPRVWPSEHINTKGHWLVGTVEQFMSMMMMQTVRKPRVSPKLTMIGTSEVP